jgi:hypothetical protein
VLACRGAEVPVLNLLACCAGVLYCWRAAGTPHRSTPTPQRAQRGGDIMRGVRRIWLLAAIAFESVAFFGCGATCGLGLHDNQNWSAGVESGEGKFRDFSLSPQRGDMEIDLSNTAMPTTPGTVDAYLTATSCTKLFDGPYPGATPLCRILVGPAPSGKVTPRAPLDAGTYRVWAQGYSSNPGTVRFLIDVDIWDNSCRAPLQF